MKRPRLGSCRLCRKHFQAVSTFGLSCSSSSSRANVVRRPSYPICENCSSQLLLCPDTKPDSPADQKQKHSKDLILMQITYIQQEKVSVIYCKCPQAQSYQGRYLGQNQQNLLHQSKCVCAGVTLLQSVDQSPSLLPSIKNHLMRELCTDAGILLNTLKVQ